jgi:hypothetical protein
MVKDATLGAAMVSLLASTQLHAQIWAWVDKKSSNFFVKIYLLGTGDTIIISDRLHKGQNEMMAASDILVTTL